MTVIAWDGKTLAVDSQASSDMGKLRQAQKSRQLEDKTVLAISGDYEEGLILMDWYEAGAKKEDWPKFQEDEGFTTLIVWPKACGPVFEYQAAPRGMMITNPMFAWGAGGPYAMGAMAHGAGASAAATIACQLNAYCGGTLYTYSKGDETDVGN